MLSMNSLFSDFDFTSDVPSGIIPLEGSKVLSHMYSFPNEETGSPPDTISAVYRKAQDLDLLIFHEAVRTKIGCLRVINPHLARETWYSYKTGTEQLMVRYLEIRDVESLELESLVDSYIEHLGNIFTVNIRRPTPLCVDCQQMEEDMVYDKSCALLVCDCGVLHTPFSCYSSRDDGKVRLPSSDESTIIARIRAYEGLRISELPQALIPQLEAYFQTKGKNCEEIRALPHNERGQKNGTSIRMLEAALQATKNTKYYWAMECIVIPLWGWKRHELYEWGKQNLEWKREGIDTSDDIRDRIIRDYKDTQRAYREIATRDSSLHMNMRLFWLLKMVGYPCATTDFRFPSTRESLLYNTENFKIACSMTGLPYYAVF